MIKYISLVMVTLFAKSMMCQVMYTKEELKQFRKEVKEIKKRGRAAIIRMAVNEVSGDPESLLNDENVHISVWYNDVEVKVEFIDNSPIKYLPYNSRYYYRAKVGVYLDERKSLTGRIIDNLAQEDNPYDGDVYLYRTTKEKRKLVDHVIQLNNTNENAFPIDQAEVVLVREKEDYYDIQVGMDYPITYKIDKVSEKIYDYEDLYKDFYPTPMAEPIDLPEPGGKWKEWRE
ncbi:hypothetical protein ABW636_21525 [Aquimarina sp. 2201CG1-2-11]|uniref:hypothetical protein n=1 Tax=Aquimarina discodermiae TaxID=3231043 RepID=UPI003461CBD5